MRLPVMTDAFTHATASVPSLLQRHIDGVELPVAGVWTVPGNDADIAVCVPRTLRHSELRMGWVNEATIIMSEDPDDVFVATLFGVPGVSITSAPAEGVGPPMYLEARSVAGPRRWNLTGELCSRAGVVPLHASLGYHGVWRRDDVTYGCFVLTGAIDAAAARPTPRLHFRFRLLASGPDSARVEDAP
jgi:hypothetical protein